MKFNTMDELFAAAQNGVAVSHTEWARLQAQVEGERLNQAIAQLRDGESDWDALKHMMGSHELPTLLSFVWHRLPTNQLIAAVGDAWTMSDAPEKHLPRRQWLPIFRKAGYHDDERQMKPPERIQLWRGGVRRTGMAWTADRERAEWFRRRYETDTPAKLWTLTVGPDRLLAHYHQDYRREDEYVIDSTGIRPREVD